ncbi:MAG TPA: hypothetical protein P5568_11375 [Acidobacteriota bacterium]|jgi:hypothetical protein|nr:hypothetical protein [Acidobacteriota bacterium]HRV09055.1 hypothetical protein [Acidobacteriota bacterium]
MRFQSKFPVVELPAAGFQAICRLGRDFGGTIRLVRSYMAAEGIDYRLPFRSWFNESGALCHQNFLSSPRGRSYDPEKERWI